MPHFIAYKADSFAVKWLAGEFRCLEFGSSYAIICNISLVLKELGCQASLVRPSYDIVCDRH